MGTLLAVSGRLQRCMNSTEQDRIAEWFIQKGYRAGTQRLHACLCVPMGRDEDERNGAMGRSQLPLELKATHPWHPHVDDQACRVHQLARL